MAETKVFYNNESGFSIPRGIIADMKRSVRAAVAREYEDTSRFEVYITVCTADRIRELNAEYRGVDKVTDVLSFPMDDFDIPAGPRELGDIIVCLEKAKEQAAEYGHSLRRELCFLCVHSALHLLGYDHENGETERKEMEKLQDAILDQLGITREEKEDI